MAIADVAAGMRSRFGEFLRSSRGNAMMITTIAAIPMIGAVGLAVDYMRGVRASEALQSVADAAALAAASARNVSGTTSEQLSQRAVIASNFITDAVASVSDIEVVGAPSVTTGPNTIDIQVNAKVNGSFISVLNALDSSNSSPKDIDLSVHSKVGFSKEAYVCLLALNPTQKEAIYFQGNSKFTSNCSVHANSDNEVAIRTWGNAEAQAASFCARGGWAGSGFEPDPAGGCPYVRDPLNNTSYVMALPTAGTCDATDKVVKDTTATLPPGTYCGGININTHGKLTLEKGIYVIKNGVLSVDSMSELDAPDGTIIYLTGESSYIDIMSGAIVQITGPNRDNSSPSDSTYPYRGWAFLQDRDSGVGNTNTIYSKGGVNIKGGVYTPSQNLVVWANDDMNANSSYFPMIVDTFIENGTATLYAKLDWVDENLDEPFLLKQAARVYVSQ